MTDTATYNNATYETVTTEPSAKLRALDRLVGSWQVTGGATGFVTYEWMAGGFFLLQHVELGSDGHVESGLEVIGHLHPFMGEPSEHVHSRYYGGGGSTLDYVYELEGDELTIWAGEVGSPAYYRGTFDESGDVLTGAWTYPVGGYESVATRVSG